jgi:hypothetical protein
MSLIDTYTDTDTDTYTDTFKDTLLISKYINIINVP